MSTDNTYLGTACKRGHLPPLRYISTRACVACTREDANRWTRDPAKGRERQRRWKEAHPDKVKAMRQQYADTHRDELRAAYRAYEQRDPNGARAKRSEANHEQALIKAQAWEAARPAREAASRVRRIQAILNETEEQREARRQAGREHYKATFERDPDQLRLQWIVKRGKQKALPLGAVCTLATPEARALLARQQGRCAYCGDPGPLELDHKTPLRRGGHHTLANVQWLCTEHNQDKGTMTDAEYRQAHECL